MPVFRDSRYAFVEGRRVGECIELDEPIPWAPDATIETVPWEVIEGETLAGIAWKLYSDLDVLFPAALWWVVAWFAEPAIIDPTIALEPGSTLNVPTARFVQDVILAKAASE